MVSVRGWRQAACRAARCVYRTVMGRGLDGSLARQKAASDRLDRALREVLEP